MKLEFSPQVFEEFSDTKFHEIPSISNRGVPREWTDRKTDILKLIIAFRNFAKAPKNVIYNKAPRHTERKRDMTVTKLLIANIKYRGRLINEAFVEL
jgi:hypothetical protein